MTNPAQLALLSKLDATAFPPNTIFVFTCNGTDGLEPRFISRCRTVEFSSYRMAAEITAFLEYVWHSEGGKNPLFRPRNSRHTVGTLLAEMGEHQLTIRDYLRHSNLSVTNKYLQAASNTKRKAQDKLVEAILPVQMRVTTIADSEAKTVAPLLHPE